MTAERTEWLEGADGLRLFCRSREGKGARGRLLALHGLGDHTGRYERIAACAAAAGLDFHGLDMRGHGRSEGRRGHARSLDLLLTDLDTFRRHVADRGPRLPTVLLGHSLGALVVGRYVQEFGFADLAGAVLVAPFVQVAFEPPAWKVLAGALFDRIVPSLTMDNEIRAGALFRTPAAAQAWESDPLVHHRISARLWGEMQRHVQVLIRRAPQCRTPTLTQVAGQDLVVSAEAARDLGSRWGGQAQVAEYAGAYHDLYHDPAAERAGAELVRWLVDMLSAQGSAGAPATV